MRPLRLAIATAIVLLLGVTVRLPYLPRIGNGYDLEEYRRWTAAIQQHGLAHVFEYSTADYVGYLYLLWGVAALHDGDLSATTLNDERLHRLLKVPGLVGDVLTTVLIIALTATLAAGSRCRMPNPAARTIAERLGLRDAEALALGAGLVWSLHPVVLYTGVYWGQQDALVTAFALGAVWVALRGRPALAAGLLVAGATLKPQPMLIAPVLAWVIVRRSGWGGALRAVAAGGVVLVLGHGYFVLTGNLDAIAGIYRDAALAPQRLTFSAYNLWWPLARDGSLTARDTALTLGALSISYGDLAMTLTLLAAGVTLAGLWRRDDDTGVLLACGYFIIAFFTLASGVHERYNVPALTFLVPAVVLERRWMLPVLALSLTATANAALTLPFQRLYPQGNPAWLPLAVAVANVGVWCWMSQLLLRLSPPDSTRA